MPFTAIIRYRGRCLHDYRIVCERAEYRTSIKTYKIKYAACNFVLCIFDYVFIRRRASCLRDIWWNDKKSTCGMIDFFHGTLIIAISCTRDLCREERARRMARWGERGGGWEGRSWHRLFTQAASWCMARCWMLSVPFIRPPLAETRDNLASDQRPLRCSLKAPCYMIQARGRHESWAIHGSVTSRLVAESTYQARTDTRLMKCCSKRLHIAQIKRVYLFSRIEYLKSRMRFPHNYSCNSYSWNSWI